MSKEENVVMARVKPAVGVFSHLLSPLFLSHKKGDVFFNAGTLGNNFYYFFLHDRFVSSVEM